MDLTLTLGAIILIIFLAVLIFCWLRYRSSSCQAKTVSHTHPHTHGQDSIMTHAANPKSTRQEKVETKAEKRLNEKNFPRSSVETARVPPPEAKKDRKVEVESMADMFSPKDNTLDELGMTEAELEEELKKYEKKRAYKQRRLPVNKNFSMTDYRQARSFTRESIKNQEVRATPEYDHKERQSLLRKALSRRNKKENSFGNVDMMATASSDEPAPARRGGQASFVRA